MIIEDRNKNLFLTMCLKYIQESDTSMEALKWVKEHQQTLVDSIWRHMEETGRTNYLDSDTNRDSLRTIGYDGRNLMSFIVAGEYLNSLILERIFANAKNEAALLLSGHSSSGKSYALSMNTTIHKLEEEAGVVIEHVFITEGSISESVNQLREKGYRDEDITIVHVYSDLLSSYKGACERFLHTGRATSIEYLEYHFPHYKGRVDFLEKTFPTVNRIYCDRGKIVTANEARQWNYDITDEKRAAMLRYAIQFAADKALSDRDLISLIYFR